jgi:hypothetical protein
MKPANHVFISRKEGDIEGSFVIDASLLVPEFRYSAISAQIDKTERNNIALWAQGGAVNVDIWLMPLNGCHSRAKIKLGAKSRITAKFVSLSIYFSPTQPKLILTTKAYSK